MATRRTRVWIQQFRDRPSLVLQWIDPETLKRKSKSAGTADPKEAEVKRADLEYELNNGRHVEASKMAWSVFREAFEREYVGGLRPATRQYYARTLNAFERICQPARLDKIDVRMVSRFAAGLREQPIRGGRKGMMASTIKVQLQYLHTALAWAVEQKLLTEVPKFPQVKPPKKKPQPVAEEAFERLLEKATDPQMRAYLLCGWLAGLRLQEAFELDWEPTLRAPWLDLERNRIILPADFVKGDADQWVALDPELRAALLALPRHEGTSKVFRFPSTGVGPTPAGQPIGVGSMPHRIAVLARQAGVRLTMRSLRRGFGCRYAGKVPAQVLRKLMRHADIKTTLEFYANVDQAAEEAILGNQRNARRNTRPEGERPASESVDATPVRERGEGEPDDPDRDDERSSRATL